jgi:hypothetical protein
MLSGGLINVIQHPNWGATTTSIRFPPNNFKHFLILFSKFFSSFPRDIRLILVSVWYLTLDGIYHSLKVAFPNSLTHQQRFVEH